MMRRVLHNFGTQEHPVFWAVPQHGRMTVRAYHCPAAFGPVTGLPHAPCDSSSAGTTAASDGRLVWRNDAEVSQFLAAYQATTASQSVEVLSESYVSHSGGVRHPSEIELIFDGPDNSDCILVYEWTVTLFGGVVLEHSLARSASLAGGSAFARWKAWGHKFSCIHNGNPTISPSERRRYLVKYGAASVQLTASDNAAAISRDFIDGDAPKRPRVAENETKLQHIDLAKAVILTKTAIAERR